MSVFSTEAEYDTFLDEFAEKVHKAAKKELYGLGRCDNDWLCLFADYLKIEQHQNGDGINFMSIESGRPLFIVS